MTAQKVEEINFRDHLRNQLDVKGITSIGLFSQKPKFEII